jgi:Domain of unknown function (DUF4232)
MVRPLILVGTVALGVAACGGSATSTRVVTRTVTASTTPASTASTTRSATPATSVSTTTAAATTSASSGTQPCTAHDLTLSFLGQQGAAGHGEIAFALRNNGTAPCHTYGFPGIQFVDRGGAPLTTIPQHTTQDYFGHAPEAELTLKPGQEASFRLGVTHGAVPGSVCTTAYGLRVIPPDDTESVSTQIPDGAYECRDATVSPLQPGSSAYR